MAEFNFVSKFHDYTHELDKDWLPVKEMTDLASDLGVMTCIWEDPENRPGSNPEDSNKVHFTIAIPDWNNPKLCQAWEEEMLKGEYSIDPKAKFKELWDKTLQGFFLEFLPDPEIQGVRCSQCQEWHHREHDHTCPEVVDAPESE